MTKQFDVRSYSLRPFRANDAGMIETWLAIPETACWFTDPDYAGTLLEQLTDNRITMRIVCFEGEPFAFVQDYDIHGWDDHHLGFLPNGSRGMDTFVGRSDMMGKGHGPVYLGIVADDLFRAGVPALGIDPHPDNARAIRAYAKLGFVGETECASRWGQVVPMSLTPGDRKYRL
jgi:aminoglycoside 6'-N-acetyltransferase